MFIRVLYDLFLEKLVKFDTIVGRLFSKNLLAKWTHVYITDFNMTYFRTDTIRFSYNAYRYAALCLLCCIAYCSCWGKYSNTPRSPCILQIVTIHTWSFLDALGSCPIPTAITPTDYCDFIPFHCFIENIIISTDVDCSWAYSGSIIADHITRDGWAVHKCSVCTSWVHCPILSSTAKVYHIAI